MSDTAESIELFLFKICPFAQRVLISLIQGKLKHELIILEPGNMPDNFKDISPLGNVPVLRVNKSASIFESSVITDYVAEIAPVSMLPDDLTIRAQMRAWSEYSVTCMGAMMQVLQAEDEDSMLKASTELVEKFSVLSDKIDQQGPYFYGEKFTTIDATYAPLFIRMNTLQKLYDKFSYSALPENIAAWVQNLLNHDSVQQSILGDFTMIYRKFISMKAAGGYIDKQLA